jgi:predicted neuraminidase
MKSTLIIISLLASLAAHSAASDVAVDLTKRSWQGIPGLERTAKGRVLVSWFTGGAKEPATENTVVLTYSDDGGKTFTTPEAMALPKSDGGRTFDPCLWIDPGGRLWYIFNRGTKDAAIRDVHARIADDPDATPLVFGPEFRIGFDGVDSAFRLNKPVALSTGEWLMPVTFAHHPLHDWKTDPKGWSQESTLQGVAISTDQGKSWKLRGGISSPPFALEGMIVELKDHRLWMLSRSNPVGYLWQSYSTNRGNSWGDGKASAIPGPGSRFFVRRLASGNLLMVNHHKYKGRSHLTARLSEDEGQTWNEGLLIDERSGVSYPDGVQDRDGLIWIVYDRDRMAAGEILLARFREEDVKGGGNVSGAVSLKQVINRLEPGGKTAGMTVAGEPAGLRVTGAFP